MQRDRLLVFVTCGCRNLAYGMSAVMMGLYLASLGLSTAVIGPIFTAALAGGALLTVAFSTIADRVGRRRVVRVSAGLMAAAAAGFALTNQPALLALAAAAGAANPSGKEVGPFGSIEQAILPQVVSDKQRTATFAAYNMVASFAGALGALALGLPELAGLHGTAGYRTLVWGYAGIGVLLLTLYLLMSERVEVAEPLAGKPRLGLGSSRGVVLKLAGLFAVDAFAGGFAVQSILAYWFALRWGVSAASIGSIFFGANVASALSFLAAAPLARRIGLLNTMVFTHLPSNILLLLVPFMPTAQLAAAMLILRFLLSQLDVPTRQSYTMAVVQPEERSAAAGITSVARNTAQAIAPAFTAATLAVPALGVPFLVSGSLKVVYDLVILATFRKLRPPEERGSSA
ncbi:MAG TPA: MFS transporter [Chloroflexota bacterium]|nr:MFS transporter [Chloroflexota bacterium]